MIGQTTIGKIDEILNGSLNTELRDQGHYLTGALEKSKQSTTSSENNKIVLEIRAASYMNPVDEGVPASRIPYNPNAVTGAGTSKYIEGLKRYAKLRFGLTDDKKALSAAFAIAKKHAKEGMPTFGSYAFSDNSRRTNAIEQAYTENESKINDVIDNGLNDEVDNFIDKTFNKTVF